ncbi:hypothetical protein ACH5RR_024819 [Cinchona calisaya]|uniref:Uncharacterized protein n=1 Tax=Cinchona calisaya TaxID=153742 RepID=A0ABD2Z1Z3_9GENT
METCFLSHPLARDKVKETKERAMNPLGAYCQASSNDPMVDDSSHSPHSSEPTSQPFVSLLDFCNGRMVEILEGCCQCWKLLHDGDVASAGSCYMMVILLPVYTTQTSSLL